MIDELRKLYSEKGEILTEIELMNERLRAINSQIMKIRSTSPVKNENIEMIKNLNTNM